MQQQKAWVSREASRKGEGYKERSSKARKVTYYLAMRKTKEPAPRAARFLTLPSCSTLRPSYPSLECVHYTIKDTWLCDLPTFRGQREDVGQKVNLRGRQQESQERTVHDSKSRRVSGSTRWSSVSILKENEDCKEATELKDPQITRDWPWVEWSSKGKSDDMPSCHSTELMSLLYT